MTTANVPKSKFGLPAKITTLDPAENVENVENVENFRSRSATYPKGIRIHKKNRRERASGMQWVFERISTGFGTNPQFVHLLTNTFVGYS